MKSQNVAVPRRGTDWKMPHYVYSAVTCSAVKPLAATKTARVAATSICRGRSAQSQYHDQANNISRCGIDTGLFLNVRKGCVLYLHKQNGSFNQAPYLDKYGEPDSGLRRGRQLFLNQKRYDALYRNVWLQQGIPTMIARKLEADINNGGWETM